uniref:Regulator of rDNA transcription 14 n=1 Tax=Ascaris lumbricoides TaxID=6252 RepID=A0A0M3IV08_ASCLU
MSLLETWQLQTRLNFNGLQEHRETERKQYIPQMSLNRAGQVSAMQNQRASIGQIRSGKVSNSRPKPKEHRATERKQYIPQMSLNRAGQVSAMQTRGRASGRSGRGKYPTADRSRRPSNSKGSIGHAFAVSIFTGNQDQTSFCPFALQEVSVLSELALGHLRYDLTNVPPQ